MIARKLISASECREISELRVTPESQTIQEAIHLAVTRTADNYIMFLGEKELITIMFLGEKELITDSDRTSSLGLRISAALPVALGVTSRLMFYFSFLHLFFPRFAAGSR